MNTYDEGYLAGLSAAHKIANAERKRRLTDAGLIEGRMSMFNDKVRGEMGRAAQAAASICGSLDAAIARAAKKARRK